MIEDSAIIPIAPSESDESVMSLLRLRDAYRQDDLISVHSSQHREMLRSCYLRAVDDGVLTRINLVIQTLGQPENGHTVWRYSENGHSVFAAHDPTARTTEITVNNLMVLTNRAAGEERLIPGPWWLHLFADTFKRLQVERESQAIRSESAAREKFIQDFTADI